MTHQINGDVDLKIVEQSRNVLLWDLTGASRLCLN
jgi:hypothetical protein